MIVIMYIGLAAIFFAAPMFFISAAVYALTIVNGFAIGNGIWLFVFADIGEKAFDLELWLWICGGSIAGCLLIVTFMLFGGEK